MSVSNGGISGSVGGVPPARRIPATIITGFLGAGKTSLIRHLLGKASGARLALLINEFGDVGVDAGILEGCGDEACRPGDIVELANGCICCTVADDFLPAITALLERPDPPDHIIIETSGLALPKPLVRAFGWPEVRTRVTIDGVVTVIDAVAVAKGLFADDPAEVARQRAADPGLDHDNPLEELFDDQLACADLVVLNKTDLLGEDDLATVGDIVSAGLRKGVGMVATSHGAIAPTLLLGLDAAAEDDLAARPSHHDGADDHDHDDFESFAVEIDAVTAPDTPDALAERLAGLAASHDVLRVKGFAEVAGRDMRLVVQGVGGRVQHYYDRDWLSDEVRTGQLVVIGLTGLDRGAIIAAITGAVEGA